jgi:CheY-like chemotaxis protein
MLKQEDPRVAIRESREGREPALEVQDVRTKPLAPVAMYTVPSLNPNQTFVRGPGKVTTGKRSAKRKQTSRGPKFSVLVVDDVSDVTEMIALLLKHAGYDVATADSGTMALRLANERTFNLIISDIGMPEMNGYELAASLRGRSKYQGIPMIAVTGYSEYHDRARALQSGFDAHLTKPIDPTALLNLMKELLG